MSNIESMTHRLIILADGTPSKLKQLTQDERKLFSIACESFSNPNRKDFLSKNITELKKLVTKIEETPAVSQQKKSCCSCGFLHLIRSFFKGFANIFNCRIGSNSLVKTTHYIHEKIIKNTPLQGLGDTNELSGREDIIWGYYDKFQTQQREKAARDGIKDEEKEKVNHYYLNTLEFEKYLLDNNIKSIRGLDGSFTDHNLNEFIQKFVDMQMLYLLPDEPLFNFRELVEDFKQLENDFNYECVPFIIDHYQRQMTRNDGNINEDAINQEIEYRRMCIQSSSNIVQNFEYIMKLYEQDSEEREKFINLREHNKDIKYGDYKHLFQSNVYAEKILGFIIHAEYPRKEFETSLKFGPLQMIKCYQLSKKRGIDGLVQFFLKAFDKTDACYEKKTETVGDFLESLSADSNTVLEIKINRLVNKIKSKKENYAYICGVFQQIQRQKYNEDRHLDGKMDIPITLYNEYLSSNLLIDFFRNKVEAIGKETNEGPITEEDVASMIDYCVETLGIIERSK